jgi:hypothetical protein
MPGTRMTVSGPRAHGIRRWFDGATIHATSEVLQSTLGASAQCSEGLALCEMRAPGVSGALIRGFAIRFCEADFLIGGIRGDESPANSSLIGDSPLFEARMGKHCRLAGECAMGYIILLACSRFRPRDPGARSLLV